MREKGQAGAWLAAWWWQGTQQPELQKQEAKRFYFLWTLNSTENVKI